MSLWKAYRRSLTIWVVGGLASIWLNTRPLPALESLVSAAAFGLAQLLWWPVTTSLSVALVFGLGAFGVGVYADRFSRQMLSTEPLSVISPLAPSVPDVAAAVRRTLREVNERALAFLGADEPDIIGLVDILLRGGMAVGASDIHIQPLDGKTTVRYRCLGVLEPVVELPVHLHKNVIGRLKVMANLVSFVTARPQDGLLSVAFDDVGSADVRVSILPTNHGEKAVLRIALSSIELPELSVLGMPEGVCTAVVEALQSPQGIIYLTGPTGSGKTTTIYASLGHIQRTRGSTTHIATIEDPVEFDLPFLTQTQVKADVGLTFAQGLRSLLRQDPNVMMVGEIRDAETAHIAVQAGLTGHLILTTLHADSAAGVFNRLIEMNVEPFLVSSASLLVVSQRLVRTLCPVCRQRAVPSAEERVWLQKHATDFTNADFFGPRGCQRCGGSGFLGRVPVYETLQVTPDIRNLITEKVPTPRIHQVATNEGMVSLLEHALQRAKAGETTLAEAMRVAG